MLTTGGKVADKAENTKNPLEGLEPWQYPVSQLECFRRGEPKFITTYTDLVNLMKAPLGLSEENPTLGDVVTKILHNHGDFHVLREKLGMNDDGSPITDVPTDISPEVGAQNSNLPSASMYKPGDIPPEILKQYSAALFEEFTAQKYKSKIHASKLVLDGVKYTGVAIATIELASLTKGTIQQLMKEDHKVLGFHLNAVTKIMMLHGLLELLGLVAHTGVVNSKYDAHPDKHGLEYLALAAKETGQTLMSATSDLFHNPYTRKNFAHCARYGLIAPLALQTFRTGRPMDELRMMGTELSGVLGPIFGDLTSHLHQGVQDGETLDKLHMAAKAIGAIKPEYGKDLEGLIAVPSAITGADAATLHGPIALQGARLGEFIKDPKQFEKILYGMQKTDNYLGKTIEKRNSNASLMWNAMTTGAGNRFADFLTLMTTVAQGLYITDEAAKSITIPAQAGFVYNVGNGLYETISKTISGGI